MNVIYLGGKLASDVTDGSYPDGTPLVTFYLKVSYKGNKNKFKVIVTGEDNIQFCKRLKSGSTVYVKGYARSRYYHVKDAVVVKDGKQNDLIAWEFFVKASEISKRPIEDEPSHTRDLRLV